MSFQRTLSVVAVLTLLAGCSTLPQGRNDHSLERAAIAGTHRPAPTPTPTGRVVAGATSTAPAAQTSVKTGNGVFVRPMGTASSGRSGTASNPSGANAQKGVVFNFENQPVEAVVKAVLGD